MLPLWGGIGRGGFGMVLQHDNRKVDAEEWANAVNSGALLKALQTANSGKKHGPWRILCDNESFLRAPLSQAAHKKFKVELWKLPAKSPDLNPVEQYWAWVRKKMAAMDLADLAAKRQAIGKCAFKARFLRLVKTPAGKAVAKNCVGHLLKTARVVKDNGGGASDS